MDVLVNYIEEIIENSEDIAAHVNAGKDVSGKTVYTVNMNDLSNELRSILKKAKSSFQQKVTTEMRYTDTVDAVQCCKDATIFSKRLLDSNVPDKLKIALFRELNIIGYMFDRTRKCYVACYEILKQFLKTIKRYEKSLSSSDLKIWNDSTYCNEDEDRISFSFGYLEGIMASIREA